MVLGEDSEYASCALTGGPRGHFPREPMRWLGAMMVRDAVRRKESAEDKEKKPFVIDKLLAKLAGPAGKADKV
ncbi:O-acetylhomoserine sulfhydrylase [Vibrio ishigakensis]|nr:O-acetylhomoserine sulfhydrylase [Vibrio ishigakensis]